MYYQVVEQVLSMLYPYCARVIQQTHGVCHEDSSHEQSRPDIKGVLNIVSNTVWTGAKTEFRLLQTAREIRSCDRTQADQKSLDTRYWRGLNEL